MHNIARDLVPSRATRFEPSRHCSSNDRFVLGCDLVFRMVICCSCKPPVLAASTAVICHELCTNVVLVCFHQVVPIVRREATRVVLVQDLHLEPVFFKTREQVLAREIAGCVGWTTRARALRRCHHTNNNIAAADAAAAGVGVGVGCCLHRVVNTSCGAR